MLQSNTPKILVIVFFAGLLAAPLVLSEYGYWNMSENGIFDKGEALQRYGFYLDEVSGDMGIDFSHKAPTLDPKLDHIMPQIASVGAAVSVVDFNNDGWQDLYFTTSAEDEPNALYKNLGDGTFEDVAKEMGVAYLNDRETGVSMGSVWADYDNDGYEDLLVYKWGKPVLFRNINGEDFTRSDDIPLPEWINSNTAVWFDYDRDGNLDLFMGGYFHESINLWNLESTKIMPESFEYSNNGGRKFLYHNLGNGKFEEVSEELGIASNRWSYAASSADIDDSGYPDLVIANDYGVDELFINQDGNGFINSGEEAGMGFAPKSGMNVSFGDVMNRGQLSIYITNISEPGVLIQGNNLWTPSTKEGDLSLQNIAGNLGIELGGWSYGAQFGDLNLDGHQDLYCANGFVSAARGTDYWYDFSKVAGGNKTIISDAKNWPAMEGRSLSGYQQNKIWINDGTGKFQEVAGAVGGSLKLDSRAVAYADLDNNGTLDIIVANQNGPARIYKTHTRENHNWVGFRLTGNNSNRSAIGAEVELFWNSKQQLQVVTSSSGFSAQNQRPVHFGIGTAAKVEKAVVTWPSGIKQTIDNPDINKLHTISEPTQS